MGDTTKNITIQYCCLECGIKLFICKIELIDEIIQNTIFHEDFCQICKELKPLANIRVFGYLKQSLNQQK